MLNNSTVHMAMPQDKDAVITTLLWQIDERDRRIMDLQVQLGVAYAMVKLQNESITGALGTAEDNRKERKGGKDV